MIRGQSLISVAACAACCLLTHLPAGAQCQPEEVAKLLASDGAEFDRFGTAVSVAGSTAIVGAYLDDDNGTDSGAAYVFRDDGAGNWIEIAKLIPSDGAPGDQFGLPVELDGDTAIIGAHLHDENGNDSGAAYIFRDDGAGNWIEVAKLLASDGASDDRFGRAVDIDGNTAIIGADGDDDNGSVSGSVYIFRGTNNWTQIAKITPADGREFARFGLALAIAGDTAVIGALNDDDNGALSGAAYIFRHGGNNWIEVTKLLPSDGAAGDEFAISVAIDRGAVIIGSWRDDDNGPDSGSAYIFRDEGSGDWVEAAKLLAPAGAPDDRFGAAVSISGGRVVVGAYLDDDNGTESGTAYIFRGKTNWAEVHEIRASDGGSDDQFGFAAAIHGDTAIVGAPTDDDNGRFSGSAYIVDLNCPSPFGASDPADVPVGEQLVFVTAHDFDEDGDNDLAVSGWGEETISILDNDGFGDFTIVQTLDTDRRPRSIVIEDFNEDGHTDLAVCSQSDDTVLVFLNDGSGRFTQSGSFNAGRVPVSMVGADIDDDGHVDLVTANRFSQNIVMLFGDGTGSFGGRTTFPVQGQPFGVTATDFDDDGLPDLAVVSHDIDLLSIFINRGDRKFAGGGLHFVDDGPFTVISDDVNDDGDPDLIAVSQFGNSVSILLNRGDGTFDPPAAYPAGDNPTCVTTLDFDEDGDLDLAVADEAARGGIGGVTILENLGDGTYDIAEFLGPLPRPFWIASADFDFDLDADLAVANFEGGNVSIFFNLLRDPPPTLILDMEIVTGRLLDGDISELLASDNEYVHTRSGFGEAIADLHKMEMLLGALTSVDNAATIDLRVEARIDERSGRAQVHLFNWPADDFDQIGSYAIGMNEVRVSFKGIDATDYISEAGEIRLLIKHNVFVPFLAFTFESFVDWVEIVVEQ